MFRFVDTISALALAIIFGAGSAYSPVEAQRQAVPKQPAWLEGCWQHSDGAAEEIWDIGFDGLMFGRSVTIRDDKLIEFEVMRIQRIENYFVFFAAPNGRESTGFISTHQTSNSITFENADHDFPQRIVYATSDDGLIATISDLGETTKIHFEMVACSP